jgi:hypothetical protein
MLILLSDLADGGARGGPVDDLLGAAYRDRQFRPAEPHPGRLVAAGDVHDDMARFTMAAYREGIA